MPDNVKHLLLVEDEGPLRQAIAEQLTDRGYHVEQAASGEQAIARLADFAFDIIVIDLRLPGVGGSVVLETAVERYPDIKSAENVQDLQDEIERLEGMIADRRELYNDQVYRYNTRITQFPGAVLAPMFGWRTREFFAADTADALPPDTDLRPA